MGFTFQMDNSDLNKIMNGWKPHVENNGAASGFKAWVYLAELLPVLSRTQYMPTQVFKKRIYEVEFKTYFVLEPSIEIQNQIQVIYLN